MSYKENQDSITTGKRRTSTCGQTLWICLVGLTLMTWGGLTPMSSLTLTPMTGTGVTPMSYRTTIGTHHLKPHELTLKQTAKQIVENHWNNQQWQCFRQIVWIESRWIPTSYNKETTAYGLGQLIGSRKYLAGKPVKQIHKTIEYISHRYPDGLACGALAHHQRWGWY